MFHAGYSYTSSKSEEQHIYWLQMQLRLIAQMGLQNYVKLQSEAKGADGS